MNIQEKKNTSFFRSNTGRFVMVGMLTLFLLIPLYFVENLISERSYRQSEVISEINSKWGKNVFFYGPILKIPYKKTYEAQVYNSTNNRGDVVEMVQEPSSDKKIKKVVEIQYAYFFPEELKSSSDVKTEIKNRNNYESAVFSTQMNFKGKYIYPDFSSQNIDPKDIMWDKATILVRTTNLSSIKDLVSVNFDQQQYSFEPIYENNNDSYVYIADDYQEFASLETTPIDLKNFKDGTFDFSIQYNGSKSISIIPIGKITESSIKSNWASPSFTGKFLPFQKEITHQGFEAHWKISHINRPFSQQSFEILPDIEKYAFSVDFIIPVDQYQQNMRAIKYGFLVIGLTFLIFFLIQTTSKLYIHIFQYTMIGISLVMFYTLLISITEHSSFFKAYLIASSMVILLICLYSMSILKSKRFAYLISSSLIALYGFIYIIIQLETYALLVGSVGLFVILALIMYASRKIDWRNDTTDY